MSNISDWELVARAHRGDTAAFAELVRRYQTPVMHFCLRMVGSEQDAEELAQDTFVRMYRHLGKLRPRAKFSTALFGIARNLTLNFIRDSKRRGRDAARPLGQHTAVRDDSLRPDRSARNAEIQNVLEAAMARLSPEHREVLALREFQGLDYETIARICKCRKGTVRSRLSRARDQLHLRLKELGGDLL